MGSKTIQTLFLAMAAVGGLVSAALWWRRESSRRQLPTPAEFAWFFDHPLIDALAGGSKTLDRVGIQLGERVLDVGSGPGRLAVRAAQRVGPEGEVVALDIQPKMLARLEKKARSNSVSNIKAHLGDVTSGLGLAADSFDRAWMVTVLGEIPDQKAALRNVFRALTPGGTLSITEIIPDPHFQTREKVLRLGKEAGFQPAKSWGWALAYTQNFTKPPEK
jgi:ubiquinone/menaquinone biosynthesis C-methylase UbiE